MTPFHPASKESRVSNASIKITNFFKNMNHQSAKNTGLRQIFRFINQYPTKGLVMGLINLHIQPGDTATKKEDSRKSNPTHRPFWTGIWPIMNRTLPNHYSFSICIHSKETTKTRWSTTFRRHFLKTEDLHGPFLQLMISNNRGCWGVVSYGIRRASGFGIIVKISEPSAYVKWHSSTHPSTFQSSESICSWWKAYPKCGSCEAFFVCCHHGD